MLKGINVNGMTRYSYDCPYCDYCLWIYVQPLTGKLIKIEKAEKEINSETPHNSSFIQDCEMLIGYKSFKDRQNRLNELKNKWQP